MRRFAGFMLLMMLMIGVRSLSVNADSGTNQIDITVSDTKTQEVVPNVSLSIYKVAEGVSNSLKMTTEFADAGVQVGDFEKTGNLETITQTLEEYLMKQNLKSLDTKTSDDTGQILFSGLEDGIYLIRQSEQSDSGYHTPAFLISAPKVDENGAYVSYITCHPKGTVNQEVTRIVVNKIWKDTNESGSRPTSITVGLYKDGRLEEKVILDAERNWYYEWVSLDSKSEWTVKELNIPKGYVSSIEMVDGVCTITNTKEKTPPPKKIVKTGDQTNVVLWAALIVISAGVMTLVISKRKKK